MFNAEIIEVVISNIYTCKTNRVIIIDSILKIGIKGPADIIVP